MGSRRGFKLGPDYEDSPVSFAESYEPEDIPEVIKKNSEYRVLTWMLIKICTVQFVRDKIEKGAVKWPLVEKIIENRIPILDVLKGMVNDPKDPNVVMGWLNQYVGDCASIALLKSSYSEIAYSTWIRANGLEIEFDRAIYHYTGWRTCNSI
jgi:hypothetical protein